MAAAWASCQAGDEFVAQTQAQGPDRVRHMALGAQGGPEGRNPREWQAFGVRGSFFIWPDRADIRSAMRNP